jgi:hypothetical protein
MFHARDDYNRGKMDTIPEHEPVFLLRAQDETAADTVRYWARMQDNDNPLRDMALQQADLMDEWPVKKEADL